MNNLEEEKMKLVYDFVDYINKWSEVMEHVTRGFMSYQSFKLGNKNESPEYMEELLNAGILAHEELMRQLRSTFKSFADGMDIEVKDVLTQALQDLANTPFPDVEDFE